MADAGFRSNGSALKRIAPKVNTQNQPVFDVVTGAFPNMLQSVVIKGQRACLPNNCASPDGPVRFNVNMQSCLSVLDLATDTEGRVNGQPPSINMNHGINFEVADPADERKRLSNEGGGSCYACHGFARTDNVVWVFGSGLGLITDANGNQIGGPDGTQQPGATKPPLNVDNRGRSPLQQLIRRGRARHARCVG
jgi:hypothetical protein